MPRLHPEDLAELGRIISEELKPVMQQENNKESFLKDMAPLSVAEAAKFLNKNTNTIYRWCRLGIIKATKGGNGWQITQQTLKNHINGNK